jgi:hypothetical protein
MAFHLEDEKGYLCIGVAQTADAAIRRATSSALRQVKAPFNAAELEAEDVFRYPGFQVAKVRLRERNTQEHVILNPSNKIALRKVHCG